MSSTVKITVVGTLQDVPVVDKAANILVVLQGQGDKLLPVDAPLTATYADIADGSYVGTVQALRADSTVIGAAISFNVIVSTVVVVDSAQSFVPASVSIEVTPN